jgi:hypothetical protein
VGGTLAPGATPRRARQSLVTVDVAGAEEGQRHGENDDEIEDGPLGNHSFVSFRLEAEVLQRLGRPPEVAGRFAIRSALLSEIALSNPSRSPVANR